MPIQYKIRRGITSEANSLTLTQGEIYMDLEDKSLRVHDGVQQGGYPLAKKSELTTKVDKINITAGTVGSGSAIPIITYNAQGQITSVSTSALNIPSNIATETYVNTQIANLVDTAPTTLDTLNELAAALGDDPNFATTITTQLGLKVNTSSLATVATSGSYNDLTNKPTIFSGSYNDLSNKPSLSITLGKVSLGVGALQSPSLSGDWNTAIGANALYNNTTGTNNTAIGYQSLFTNASGNDNVAIGYQALKASIASGNIAIGKSSLQANTTGSANTAIGFSALTSNTTGYGNSAFGSNALQSSVDGGDNSAFGFFSLYLNTSGYSNTAYGNRSLRSNTTGYNNTAIGQEAGTDITTGSNNTIVGRFTGNQNGIDIRTSNNNIILSDGQGNVRFRSDSAGNITLNGNVTAVGLVKLQQTSERVLEKTNASSTVEHNFSESSIWYHTSISLTFTPNFTNVPTDNNWNSIVTLVLSQSTTPYIPTSIQINGVSQTIKWINAEVPTGNANSIDVISFSLMRISNNWTVLGSLTRYA